FFSSDPTRASDDTGGSPSATGSATTLVEPRLRGNQRLLNLKSAENAFYQIVPADWRHFRHDGAINFSSGSRSRGQFRRNQFQTDGSDFWDKRVGNFTAVFSGLLYVPASRTQTTFAVGSEDGFRLRIAKSSNALASAKDGLRRGPGGLSVFRTGPVLKARLDRTMRAFPYELLFFAEPGNEGVEFSSAPGRHDTFKKGPFSLVEATRIAAPELETELEMEDGNGGDLSIGDPIDWRLKIRNTGDAYAWDVWFIPQTFNTLSTPTLKSRPAGARSGTLDFRGNRHDGWVVPVLAPGESVELKLRSDFRQRRRGNAIGQAQVVGRATPKGTIDQFRLRQLRTERLDD
ncbi:MAG: hypothetical protein ABEL76_07865, partial [Bradymonadaceae bacterium]